MGYSVLTAKRGRENREKEIRKREGKKEKTR
jgi:hypothetical protein